MELTARQTLARTILLTRQQRLPDVDEEMLIQMLAGTTVAIVADEENVITPSAQAAITTLVSLTAACGVQIRLVMPEVPVAGYQPPLFGKSLVAGLHDLAADVVAGAAAVVDEKTRRGDVAFVIGSTPWNGEADNAWRLAADDWCGSMLPVRTSAKPISARLPLGSLAAATAASAEPYRTALRRLVAATGCQVTEIGLLRPAPELTIRLAPSGTPSSDFGLRALDLVSAGALSSAVLHVLLRVQGLDAAVRLWEPQDAEGSNLNRYALLRRSMLPITKVEMLTRWAHGSISIAGFAKLVDEEVVKSLKDWAPWVFVGADTVEARWLVQRAWPRHLVVAGTAGFMAMASEHDRERPCAGCLHPASNPAGPDIATISFVSYLGGLLGASRLLRWSVAGPAPAGEQMTEAYADRLDSPTGYRSGPVTRLRDCPVGCGS